MKEQIRKDAFWMLAEKCNIRNFRIEQRIKLLSDGLNDRSYAIVCSEHIMASMGPIIVVGSCGVFYYSWIYILISGVK